MAKSTLEHNNLADQAAVSADEAIKSTKRVADQALDSLSDGVENTRNYITPALNRASERVTELAQRGIDAARNGVDAARNAGYQVRDKAYQATDTTAGYIKNDPIKAVLIAAATGAVLMGLVSLFSRSRDRS